MGPFVETERPTRISLEVLLFTSTIFHPFRAENEINVLPATRVLPDESKDKKINWHVMTDCFLVLLPRVEVLSINFSEHFAHSGEHPFGHAEHSQLQLPKLLSELAASPFQSLKAVELTTVRETLRLSSIIPILMLQSLESFESDALIGSNVDKLFFTVPCRLQHLTLTRSCVSTRAVASILQHCKLITHLHLGTSGTFI